MQKENKYQSRLPIWIFFALALGVLLGYAVKNVTSGRPVFEPTAKVSELDQVLFYVNEHYVDSVDVQEVEDEAIVQALQELDPHSVYLNKDVLKNENEQMEGEYEGVGIEFFILKDTIQVSTVMNGGPSDELGIKAGDKIITVNDSLVAGTGITNSDVISLLKGRKGTIVDVGIKRGKRKELLDFEITRAPIAINSIDVAYMISDTTGYIKINLFSTKTFQEFQVQLDKLIKSGMENLIIDLRGNGGGIMRDALQILDQLIDGNKTLLTAKGRNYPFQEYQAVSEGLFENGKLAVLIDEGSASASEIVAGAIQDWDRGVIIGRRSFGKGLVQQSYPLKSGGGLRLTVARYYTPSGRSIQRSYENGVEDYYSDFYDRSSSGEMISRDSIKVDSSLTKETLVKKRTVFGGGGIMPDIFIPVDTTKTNEFSTAVYSKGLTREFIYNYADQNQKVIESYSDATDFENRFFVSNSVYQNFVDYAKSLFPKKEFSETDIQSSQSELSQVMKALLARQQFGEEGFYAVFNDSDEMILKALYIFQNEEYESILQLNDSE